MLGSATFKNILTRRREILPSALVLSLFAGPLAADTVTLPAAASLVRAVAPFFSDVRVFNTSYTSSVAVTAVYRCFGCSAPVAPQVFTLGARESKAFDDICNQLFGVPNSIGAVEFSTPASVVTGEAGTEGAEAAGVIVVTSRVYSPLPPPATSGSVGMFIPGLPSSAAKVVTVLTNLMNGDFRTNIGAYNPNVVPVTATIRLFDGPVLLGTVPVSLGAQSGAQVNDIYGQVKFGSLRTTNGYATVESSVASAPLFTYAAEADNTTQDTIFVVGAEDLPAPAGFNPPTATTIATVTPTPTPTLTPTPTPTPTATAFVHMGDAVLGNVFVDQSSGNNTTTISAGHTVEWDWAAGLHNTRSGTCSGTCAPDGLWSSQLFSSTGSFSHNFPTAGTYPYFCSVHGASMTGQVIVSP